MLFSSKHKHIIITDIQFNKVFHTRKSAYREVEFDMHIKRLFEFEGGQIGYYTHGHVNANQFISAICIFEGQNFALEEIFDLPERVRHSRWSRVRDQYCIEECDPECQEHYVFDDYPQEDDGIDITFIDLQGRLTSREKL